MLRRLLLIAIPLILAAARGPALLAVTADDLGALALIPALRGSADTEALPECGAGGDVGSATRWFAMAEGLGGEGDGEGILKRGLTAWADGECGEAEAAWQRACTGEFSGGSVPFCFRLFLSTEGQAGAVPQDATRAAADAYRYGYVAQDSGEEGRAIFAYRLSLELDANRMVAERLTGLYRREGRTEDRIAVWDNVAAALPEEDADHWWAVGRVAQLKERWAEAAQAYGRGAELAKDPYQFWMAQGDAYRRAQAFGLAEGGYRRAMDARPDAVAPYERLGHVRRSREDLAGARDLYREAARIDPERVAPWYYIGLAYYQEKDVARAKAAFERALTIDPEHAGSTYYLARCLQRGGDLEEAADTLARAIELHNGEPWHWAQQLGDWRRDLGDREGALEAYEQALEWRPGEESIEGRIDDLVGDGE